MSIPELIARAHALGLPSTLIHNTLQHQGADALAALCDQVQTSAPIPERTDDE